MTVYFDTVPAPRYCPMCGAKIEMTSAIDIREWNGGVIFGCPDCNFEYAKAPDDAPDPEALSREILEQQSKIQALTAIIEESAGELLEYSEESYHNQAVIIGAKVVEMIRDEARQAVIDVVNTPLGDLLPKREAAGVCRCADPFAAID